MADSAAFEYLGGELESASTLDRLESRGTVRIVLKAAGLDSRSVTPAQLSVVVEKLLCAELITRGVDDAAALCEALCAGLSDIQAEDLGDSPEAVFSRLGGDR